jgi:hypothetical protein
MVDSEDTDSARQRASNRLFELGWASIEFGETVLLPSNPDTSSFNKVMLEAVDLAKELGVSLIVYPEVSDAA